MRAWRSSAAAALALVAALALAGPASAADPGRWRLSQADSVSLNYFQGLTHSAGGKARGFATEGKATSSANSALARGICALTAAASGVLSIALLCGWVGAVASTWGT